MDTLIGIATVGARMSFATIDRTFSKVDSASVRLSALLNRSDRLLGLLDTTTRTAGPELANTEREAQQSLREIHSLLADFRDAFAQEGGVNQMVRNLSAASDNIARLTARLDRDPTSVLKQREPPNKPTGPKAK